MVDTKFTAAAEFTQLQTHLTQEVALAVRPPSCAANEFVPPADSAAPTAATARDNEAKQIEASGHAVTITGVSELTLPNGKAFVIKYTSNSEPNTVTNKRLRLENEAVLYFRNGKEATLTLWAPLGADNVDQWDRMKKSFRWM